ncbi:MAG: 30S ribosomal protein S6 [Candidatus Uhrbacteria bacterium GW2011_GWF2_39_13]|uniref:Small ribosomal subunit protein bS6 n=1 Tax=Candidatus Uhrbacteria bacterium GW2011_GWF2_39_13 TaxID=1618995 RepID=A0A0G0MMI3_9BACT|nr:MAG: 30S ribosomal protein S6 [Candidatus Uhrbacteria bacterium GW2011_GWF2_39_13]
MKGYELLYIVGTQYTDEEVGGIQETIAKFLGDLKAKVLRNENLGKIRLAYPIKKISHGSYILVHFDANSSIVQDFNRRLGLMDEVLRHTLLTRVSGALEKTFEISSYVPPLSEESKQEKETKRPSLKTSKKSVQAELPSPRPVSMEESSMSMEELDQKLDQILEGDIAKNI